MKNITPVVLASITLAFCGCTSADGPIFSSDSTKPTGTNAGPTGTEQARDINHMLNSPLNENGDAYSGNDPGGGTAPPADSMRMNPYGN